MSTQTDAQAEQPDRQALQAAGTHPAPCARHCEAQAFEIAARGMRRQIAELQAALAEQPAQQEEPPTNKYNDKRIAWELERTAMGDGYYGNALYVAMDMPQATAADKEMLHRYMHGSNTKTDHVKLQDLAMRVYTTPQAQPAQETDPDALTAAYMSGVYEGKKRRPWVGLNASDLAEIPPSCYEGAIWADARLMEKNT